MNEWQVEEGGQTIFPKTNSSQHEVVLLLCMFC